MNSIYLRCDICGATYDGEKSDAKGNLRVGGIPWSREHELRDEGRAQGWTGPLDRDSTTDRCPACSKTAGLSQLTHKFPPLPRPIDFLACAILVQDLALAPSAGEWCRRAKEIVGRRHVEGAVK